MNARKRQTWRGLFSTWPCAELALAREREAGVGWAAAAARDMQRDGPHEGKVSAEEVRRLLRDMATQKWT